MTCSATGCASRRPRWNEKGHPAAARVEVQREPSARSPELPGATQGAIPHHDTTGDANAALVAPTSAGDDGKGSLVVALPDGWRVIDTPLQWIVEAGQKSGGWRRVAWYASRDSLIRQLPERLWGPCSGRALPDEVLATLRALPASHPGEAKRPRKARSPNGLVGASSPDTEEMPQFSDDASVASNPVATNSTLEAV
jgi:hypothetical protein